MGFERAGMECVWQVENDKYCQEVLAEHWKGVKRFSDVREVGKHNLQPVDLICGGFPCFPSGTLILTDKGYVPIEDVTRGTMVFTHRGRLMPVISTMKRDNADIISLSGRGNNKIRTTKEHPFYCREYGYKYENRVKHINLTEPSWEAAENMLDKYWASPTAFTKTNIPKFEYEPSLSAGAEHNAQFVWQMNHADEVYRDCGEKSPTLQNRMGTGGNNVPLIGVRRLTPTECERLQGFPDGWTASQSDTQRYKQMGNAVTVNVIEWIGKRIVNENL